MKSMFKTVMAGVAIALACSSSALGASANLVTNVIAIVQDDNNFGGCMANISPGPETVLGGCGNYYITFSCDGTFNTKSQANAKLNAAQLAYAAAKKVYVTIDDTKLHNGYCFASRVDNRYEAADAP